MPAGERRSEHELDDVALAEAQVAALAAAPAGTDRAGKIAAQIMLGLGGGCLILAALALFLARD